jgi:hypothetical protein
LLIGIVGILGVAGLTGCAVRAATLASPAERLTECRSHCSTVGLEFSALVIVSNRAGCVCTPAPAEIAPPAAAGATSTAILSGAAATAELVTQVDEADAEARGQNDPADRSSNTASGSAGR